jgi:hypothetical protein
MRNSGDEAGNGSHPNVPGAMGGGGAAGLNADRASENGQRSKTPGDPNNPAAGGVAGGATANGARGARALQGAAGLMGPAPAPLPAEPFVFTKPTSQLSTQAGVSHLWGLGIVIVLGGQYFSWNAGLSAGFGSFLIATVLVGVAYIGLCCSLAEMTSCLQVPFAGGSYAFTRAMIGMLSGFMVAVAETMEYIM